MKNKFKHLTLIATFGSAFLAAPVLAVIDDSPYFNLWEAGVSSGGETGMSDTVSLCGTSACSSSTAAINYAVFTTVKDPDTARGSGAIDPFLRFQHNEGMTANGADTIERAFNTSNTNIGTITDDTSGTYENQAKDSVAGGQMRDTFNHAIKLSDLLAMDGQYSFLLDINEPVGGPNGEKTLLRLDELSFFLSTTDQLNEFTRDDDDKGAAGFTDSDGVAYKVWDMDFNADSPGGTTCDTCGQPETGDPFGGLLLDNINDTGPAGSGDYDLEVKLQKELFDQVIADAQANHGSSITADNAYVYLYNFAGEEQTGPGQSNPDDGEAAAGFEEWAVVTTPGGGGNGGGSVPEPATALLLLGGIAGMYKTRRRRRAI